MAIVTVTYLQMFTPEEVNGRPCPDPRFQVLEATVKQWEFNRFLYSLVGSRWAWLDKLSWSDGEWIDYVESESLKTYVAYYDGSPAGYFELRHDALNDVEITYFGLAPKFIGRGLGGYLLTVALEQAWALSPHRVWVHTCSRDHASALPNYQARGFKIYQEEYVPL